MMEHLDAIAAAMPPPQSPGVSHNRMAEFNMQHHHQVKDFQQYATEISGNKQRMSEENDVPANMKLVNGKKQRMSEETDVPTNKKLVTTSMDSEDYKTHSNPVTIWKECTDQLQKELETSSNEWLSHWHQLHEEEKGAMARIQELFNMAKDMNINFHQQLDSLHNTVVDVVSSFKK